MTAPLMLYLAETKRKLKNTHMLLTMTWSAPKKEHAGPDLLNKLDMFGISIDLSDSALM
jgi:hypothetical protein